MPKSDLKRRFLALFLALFTISLLAACGDAAATESAPPVADTQTAADPTAVPTATSVPPTPTIPPTPTPQLAALVNGRPILLADYERELARFTQAQTALGLEPTGDEATQVLDALIERALMQQAAETQGIAVTAEMVDARLAELRTAVGGDANFDAWLAANAYTLDEFRAALQTEMLTEQVVAAVTADVPTAVEQVRARYIQVDDPALAQSLLDQLNAGADFAFLAQQNSVDRLTAQNGGDLGFFARGALLVPAVEEAAFALQPEEISSVIAVTDAESGQMTYYLVQLLERDPSRALPADMRFQLLQQRFEAWLQQLVEQADITRFS